MTRYAKSTELAYQLDAKAFAAWCATAKVKPSRAKESDCIRFLYAEMRRGLAFSTIQRRRAGVAMFFLNAGLVSTPMDGRWVDDTMRDIKSKISRAPNRKLPIPEQAVRQILKRRGDTMIAKRNRALIAVAYGALGGRTSLERLTAKNLVWNAAGDRLLAVWLGEHQGSGERKVSIPIHLQHTIGAPLVAWLKAARITKGPIWRRVYKGGHVGKEPVTAFTLARIVKEAIQTIGGSPPLFSLGSLRAGRIRTDHERGVPLAETRRLAGLRREASLLKHIV